MTGVPAGPKSENIISYEHEDGTIGMQVTVYDKDYPHGVKQNVYQFTDHIVGGIIDDEIHGLYHDEVLEKYLDPLFKRIYKFKDGNAFKGKKIVFTMEIKDE